MTAATERQRTQPASLPGTLARHQDARAGPSLPWRGTLGSRSSVGSTSPASSICILQTTTSSNLKEVTPSRSVCDPVTGVNSVWGEGDLPADGGEEWASPV